MRRLTREFRRPSVRVAASCRFEMVHHRPKDLGAIVVFPEPQHCPTILPQNGINALVSISIGLNLGAPPFGI